MQYQFAYKGTYFEKHGGGICAKVGKAYRDVHEQEPFSFLGGRQGQHACLYGGSNALLLPVR